MRAEKQNITNEYLARLNASPFFIVVDYTGLEGRADHGTAQAPAEGGRGDARGQELHLPHRGEGSRRGGSGWQPWPARSRWSPAEGRSAAAKAVKTFAAEFDKLKIKFGYLNNQRLEAAEC